MGIGTLDTVSCKSYYKPVNVPFLEATIRNGRMIGEQYTVGSSTSRPTIARMGAAWRFEWKINLASDGRRFTIDILAGKGPSNPRYRHEYTTFLRW